MAPSTLPLLLLASTLITPALSSTYHPLLARQSTTDPTCADVGWKSCGATCIPLDYTCCPDQQGGCPTTGFVCWLGSNNEYGCCVEGETCSGPGGVDTILPTTTRTGGAGTQSTGSTGGGSRATTTAATTTTRNSRTTAIPGVPGQESSSFAPSDVSSSTETGGKTLETTRTSGGRTTQATRTTAAPTTATTGSSGAPDTPGAAPGRVESGTGLWAVVAGLAGLAGMLL